MDPFTGSDLHDFPGLVDEAVPGVAAMVEDIFVGFEDPVREPAERLRPVGTCFGYPRQCILRFRTP